MLTRTVVKLLLGLAFLAGATGLQLVILVLVLPSRAARIRSCIVFARLVGFASLWLIGCRLTVEGGERFDPRRPAIYVLNHTSLLDLFIVLRLMPRGSVGVAKQEVVRYPFFGQIYLLSGHLRLNRGRHAAAVASLVALAELVRRHRLSVFISPEGTRSSDGRLQPFRKGFVHLALTTGLPVVPVIVHGAHWVWPKGSLAFLGGAVRVEVLPAVETTAWCVERVGAAVEQIHALFREHLSVEQRPAQRETGAS